MQRGQATAEYLGLVLLLLVCACALVRFHTPVQSLAGELARRRLAPADFTVIRPSLEDAVVSLLTGGSR